MKKKLVKILLVEIIVVAVIFIYFFPKKKINNPTFINNLTSTSDEKTVDISLKSKVYLELEKGLLEGKEHINLKMIALFKDPKEIFKALEEISSENPEVMYYKGAEYQLGSLNLFYSRTNEKIKKHQDAIREIKEQFISKYISQDMTDYEKVLTIHDYIINNSQYDDNLFTTGTVPPESYSTYGILALGRGVCEGYAKAMKYLLDGVGIESMIVVGKSNGENHAWNLVKLDDEYYHIDATWDDPVTKDGSNILRYNFFNLDDEEISKTHSWNKEDYPSATGKTYNYFIYNGLVINGVDELGSKIKNTLLNREAKLLVKINNYNNDNIVLSKLVEEIAYENYKLIKLKSYSYSLDEEYGIASFEFYYQ